MSENNRELVSRVYNALKNDSALQAYVKSFTKGDMRTARALFPFVTVGNLRYTFEPYSTAEDLYVYSLDIYAGVRSLVPGLAFEGNDDGKQGIIQLSDDICRALRGNCLDDFLDFPISNLTVTYSPGNDSSGIVWTATVALEAKRLVFRG